MMNEQIGSLREIQKQSFKSKRKINKDKRLRTINYRLCIIDIKLYLNLSFKITWKKLYFLLNGQFFNIKFRKKPIVILMDKQVFWRNLNFLIKKNDFFLFFNFFKQTFDKPINFLLNEQLYGTNYLIERRINWMIVQIKRIIPKKRF